MIDNEGGKSTGRTLREPVLPPGMRQRRGPRRALLLVAGGGQEPQLEDDLDGEPGPPAPSQLRGQPSQLRAGPEAPATEAVAASPPGLRPLLTAAPPSRGQPSQLRGLRTLLLTAAPPRISAPAGLALELRSRQEALPIDSSPTSSNVEQVTLTGEELRSWPTLPHTVAFQGVHRGPDPPEDVIANFFPDTLQLLRDFASGEALTTPLELRRLTAGKSRAVYDFQPTRQYLLKLSVPGGHGFLQ